MSKQEPKENPEKARQKRLKEERIAEALRANLRRRKTQSRERKEMNDSENDK